MKRHTESCSCTNCAYKSRSKRPSVQQVVADGTRIDKLFYGKYLPLRERKLLEKLVRTRAVYDNVKDRLLSTSGSSDQTRSGSTGKSRGYYSNTKKKMVDVTYRGEIRSSNTSKLSSCCNCCSCSSIKKIKESIEKHPHVHKHYVPYENIAKYKMNVEKRAKAKRRRLGSKISGKMRDLRFKSKNIRSDPCFCTLSLVKFSSKRSIKKLVSKEDSKGTVGPPISFAESELEERNKPGQKLKSIKQSIVNSIESRFKIKKDSLSLFRAKLRKRAMRRRTYDSESLPLAEFRPRRRRRQKKSYHKLSGMYVKSISTSSTSKPKLKNSAVKMKSKAKTRKRHKSKRRKILNQESQVSVLSKIASKLSQYQQRKSHTSSSTTTTSSKTNSKSEVQTQIKPKSTPKHHKHSSAQSNSLLSLKKNQTDYGLRRCFCTLKLQKKKRNLKTSTSKKTMVSFSTQRSDKRDRMQKKIFDGEYVNVPLESLVSFLPTECEPFVCTPRKCDRHECAKVIKARYRREVKRNRKLTNTKKISKKSTSSLIFEGKTPTRQEKTQSIRRKRKHTYAKRVEVHRPSVNDTMSQVVKSNKTTPTNTVAFWHKCFCTLKFFNKDGLKKKTGSIIRPEKKSDVSVKMRNEMTIQDTQNIKYLYEPTKLLPLECEPGICVPDQCNPQECEKFIKARHARSKNKYSDTSAKNIVLIHENPKLLPGVCIPDQCNPYECEKLIKQRTTQHKNKYQDTNVNTRSTYSEIPKHLISSKTQQTQSQAREKKINKINHYPKEPEENIGSRHSNREAVRIGSNFSFNIEFYKERSQVDSTEEINNTSKVKKKQMREKSFKKPEYTKPRQVNIRTRGSQSTMDSKHIALSAEPKTKKRNVYVGSPKKTKCLCTLKLHKKGRNAKNKENIFLTSKSTKTTLQLHGPGLNTSVIKSTNTSKILKHDLKSYKCTPGFCVPGECDPYKCYDVIKKRDMKRYRGRHVATGREIRSVVSMTSSEFSSSNKSRSTQSSSVAQPLHENRVKKGQDKVESNYSPSRQAIRMGSNFSFNIDFYKDHYNPYTRGKTVPTMFNTVGNLTYISKIKQKNAKQRQYISKHHLLHASDIVKTNDKTSNVGNILKRCFCSLMLHSKEYGRNEKNPDLCSFSRGIKQFAEVIPSQKYKNSICKLQSLTMHNVCITTKKLGEKYRSGHETHIDRNKLNRNGSIIKIKSQNGFQAINFNRTSHSSYNEFEKYDENTNNSIPKLQQHSEYRVRSILNDPSTRNGNLFYKSYYALNLKVSQIRKIPQVLEDDECEPGFCVPYQCDTVECLKRIKSRFKSLKETETDLPDTTATASMTDRKRLSHNYAQADKHSALKVFHPTKRKKRYGSSVKLNMSVYTHSDDSSKEPGKRAPIPPFYNTHRNNYEDENTRDYNWHAPTRPQRSYIYDRQKHIKQKPSRMSSLKKYATFKFRSQDKQRDNMIEVDAGGTAMVNNQDKISQHIKLMNTQTEPALLPKYSRRHRRKQIAHHKTTNIQTEPAVTKSTYIGKERKSMNIATQHAILNKLIHARKRESVNFAMEPEIKSIYSAKSRKLKNIAMEPEVTPQPIQSSKSRKSKKIEMEPEVVAQPIQSGKSRKLVQIAEPEVLPKVIYSGKYNRTMHVPTDPNELPKSIYKGKHRERMYASMESEEFPEPIYRGKYRERIESNTPIEPEVLSKSSYSTKYRKLMNIRTDRASRLARSRRTKMPDELEKFLMKPPRRKVYTIGSSINFSMQFYKEDDHLAVDEKQKAGQTDASSGIIEKIRCFCTSKKRDSQGIKSKKEGEAGETISKKEPVKSKVLSKSKVLGKSTKSKGESKGTEEVSKKSGETQSEVLSVKEESEYEGLTKTEESKVESNVKSKLEDTSEISKSICEVLLGRDQKEILPEGYKSKRKMFEKIDISKKELSSKIEKIEDEVPEKIDKSKEEAASKKLEIKSICKCKMPVCTCKLPICKCKMPECTCKLPICECKGKEGRKEKGKEKGMEQGEEKGKEKGKKKGKEKDGLCDCDPFMKPRRLRSKSTKVSHNALSVKSDVLSYDKSTITGGKRFSKSLYECEPHVCIPGVCDPNVCYKIFKCKRRVKDISISATKDVKSKSVGTPFLTSILSSHVTSSAVKRCFCILKLKNRQAQRMIAKSFPSEKQEKKDIQRPEAQNIFRKSFGKVSARFKKAEIQRKADPLKFEVEKVHSSKQDTDMEIFMPPAVKHSEQGPQQYALDDYKLAEVVSRKRKRHSVCKCQQNLKEKKLRKKKVCECVQQYLDTFKYPQPEPRETIQSKVKKEPAISQPKVKKEPAISQPKVKKEPVMPQLKVKIEQLPMEIESTKLEPLNIPKRRQSEPYKKYQICKCKKLDLHKSVCKCQLREMDYSTTLEPETPVTDIDTSDENKRIFQKIKAIPPRLSQSLKSKLEGSIRKKSKPDKTSRKIKQTLSSEFELDITDLPVSKGERRKSQKDKTRTICKCPTCKCIKCVVKRQRLLDAESSKTDIDTKKRKKSFKKIPSKISESIKSLILSNKKKRKSGYLKQEVPKKSKSQKDESPDVKKRKSKKIKQSESLVVREPDKIKQKILKQKSALDSIKSKPRTRDLEEDYEVEEKETPKLPKKKHKLKESLSEESIKCKPCELDKEFETAKKFVCECGKKLTSKFKEICECKMQDIKDLEKETTDSEMVKPDKARKKITMKPKKKQIEKELDSDSEDPGTPSPKKKKSKPRKSKPGIDRGSQCEVLDTSKPNKKKRKSKKVKLSIEAASQSEEPETISREKKRKSKKAKSSIKVGDVVQEKLLTESKMPKLTPPVLGISDQSKPKSEKIKSHLICKCLPEGSKRSDKSKAKGICECPVIPEPRLPPPSAIRDQGKSKGTKDGVICECLTPGLDVSGQIKRFSLKAKFLSSAVGHRIKRISGVNIGPVILKPESPGLAVSDQKPPDLAAGDQIKAKSVKIEPGTRTGTKPKSIKLAVGEQIQPITEKIEPGLQTVTKSDSNKLAAGDQKPKDEVAGGTKQASLLLAPLAPIALASEMIRKSQKIDQGLAKDIKFRKSKEESKSLKPQSIKLALDERKKKRKSDIPKEISTLAVCPCCGKSNIQSQEHSVCECHKSDTSFLKYLFKKKTPPPQPMIPGLEKVCPVCLRRSLTDICTCGQPLSSKKVKDAHIAAPPLQNVCPECSKKNLTGAYPPHASSRQSYSGRPNLHPKIETQKQKRKKGEPPPPPPIFSMVVDATSMQVKNKQEIYRNLGVGCKEKLQGRYLPPAKKGTEIQPSIDLVIDRDNACILRPEDMMQPFGDGDKRKYSIMRKGGEAGTSHSVACPFCNPLPVTGATSKRPQGEEHDKHCTCCICTDKDGKRKKGHPKNCTCCICRYGCRFGSGRRPTEASAADPSKFPDKGQLVKFDKPGKKGKQKNKGHKTADGKEKIKKPPILPVALQAHNTIKNIRKFTKVFKTRRFCLCGLNICDKEINKLEKKATSGIKGDMPPPCICGSIVCKKKYTKKTPYYREKEKQRLKDAKRKKERFSRWKKEALARINEQDAEDSDMRKRIKRQDKKAMNVLEKYIEDTNSWVLLAENASDIGRFGINTVRRMITSVKRCVRHPLDICYRTQIARADPRRAAAKALEEFQGSGYGGTAARVRQRCAAMQTSKYLISAMETHPVTNFLLHFRDKDPKKRLFKRKSEKKEPDFECSPFMTSLRQRPCLWLYRLCPWFYPHCLGLLAFWRQFTDVILFLLAVAVWSPCILLTEFCRSVMCCFMCAGGG